ISNMTMPLSRITLWNSLSENLLPSALFACRATTGEQQRSANPINDGVMPDLRNPKPTRSLSNKSDAKGRRQAESAGVGIARSLSLQHGREIMRKTVRVARPACRQVISVTHCEANLQMGGRVTADHHWPPDEVRAGRKRRPNLVLNGERIGSK